VCDDGFAVHLLRRLSILAGAALLTLSILSTTAAAKGPEVFGLHLDGVVDPFIASYVVDGISEANRADAGAILITIDTPGGLDSSMRKIIQAIRNSEVPVICYVAPQGARAASAGTFILLACPVASMAPGTNVGAAHPVGVFGAIQQDKAVNDAVAYIRALAEATGRNADWAERAVRDSVSASANEALELDVIDLVAPDAHALLASIDGREVDVGGGRSITLATSDATVSEKPLGPLASLVHPLFSPNLAFIFFYLGLVLLAIELLHPGVSVPGILGVLSMVTAFAGLGMLPIQLVGLVLLVASVVFFFLELQHPGIGVPSVGGVVSLVFGGLLLFNRSVPGVTVSLWTIVPVALGAAAFFAFAVQAALKIRGLPKEAGGDRLLGQTGIATTKLDPEGVIHVAAESWSAEATSGQISKGDRVRIVGAEGLRLKVEPFEDGAKTSRRSRGTKQTAKASSNTQEGGSR
jgi:membrane-bound serine protease (ClpP class)